MSAPAVRARPRTSSWWRRHRALAFDEVAVPAGPVQRRPEPRALEKRGEKCGEPGTDRAGRVTPSPSTAYSVTSDCPAFHPPSIEAVASSIDPDRGQHQEQPWERS